MKKDILFLQFVWSRLISVYYFLQIKLYFQSNLNLNEIFEVPIDFIPRPDINKINNKMENNNNFNSKENLNSLDGYNPAEIKYAKPREINPEQNKNNENVSIGENQNTSNVQLEKQNLIVNEEGIAPLHQI